MRVIGLIGGCGTGKTKVAKILEQKYNAFCIIADTIGHSIIKKGTQSYELIVEYFGDGILDNNLEIDRKALGQIVFNDKNKLLKLNTFTHPYMHDKIRTLIDKKKAENQYQYIVLEAAVMIEAKFYVLTDYIWYVTASFDKRIERLEKYRNIHPNKAKEIISRQHDDAYFLKHADIVIDNSNKIDVTYREIAHAINTIEEDESNANSE